MRVRRIGIFSISILHIGSWRPWNALLGVLLLWSLSVDLIGEDLPRARRDELAATLAKADEATRLSAAVEAGACQGPNALAVLTALLADRRYTIHSSAAQALLRMPDGPGQTSGAQILVGLLGHRDGRMRAKALPWAAQADPAAVLKLLPALVADREAAVRRALLATLLETPALRETVLASDPAIQALGKLASDRDLAVRLALNQIAALAAREDLAKIVLSSAPQGGETILVDAAVQLGATTMKPLVVQVLNRILSHPQVDIRAAGAEALGLVAGDAAIPTLLAALNANGGGKFAEVRAAIADAIGFIAPSDPAVAATCEKPLALMASRDNWWGARQAAGWALLRLGSKLAPPALILGLGKDGDAEHRDLLRTATGERWKDAGDWKRWWTGVAKEWKGERIFTVEEVTNLTIYQVTDATRGVAFAIELPEDNQIRDVPTAEGGTEQRTIAETVRYELWRQVSRFEPGTRFCVAINRSWWRPTPLRATWRNKALLKDMLDQGLAGTHPCQEPVEESLDQPLCESVVWICRGDPSFKGSVGGPETVAAITNHNFDRSDPRRLHTVGLWFARSDRQYDPVAEKSLADIAAANGGSYKAIR